MIGIEGLTPKHLRTLELQDSQTSFSELISNPEEYVRMVCQQGQAFAVVADGETMVIAGLIEMWEGRSLMWSLMSKNAGKHMRYILKATERMITTFGARRVESTVDCDFKQGHRFMRLLGFQMEAERMKSYEPDGRDCALYARIQ